MICVSYHTTEIRKEFAEDRGNSNRENCNEETGEEHAGKENSVYSADVHVNAYDCSIYDVGSDNIEK